MRRLLVSTLIAGLLLSQGCSAFQPKTMPVLIQPSVSSAEILVDGQSKGKGTLTVELPRNKDHIVEARVGDRTGTAQIKRKISTTGVLDIVGSFLFIVPIIGLITPGFWDLEPTHVNVIVPSAEPEIKVEPAFPDPHPEIPPPPQRTRVRAASSPQPDA